MKKTTNGFTLIELLIVVAIIAILAAIAIPNFLAAQVRAKVSRVKSDMRTITTGLESYNVDSNAYPCSSWPFRGLGTGVSIIQTKNLYALTTPVSYLSSVPKDIFSVNNGGFQSGSGFIPYNEYYYMDRQGYRFTYGGGNDAAQDAAFNTQLPVGAPFYDQQVFLMSVGPSGKEDPDTSLAPTQQGYWALDYDPSNGTVSPGQLNRWLPWLSRN